MSPDDPEPTIAASALIGLWEVQRRALRRDCVDDRSVDDVYRRAQRDVERAARLIDTGLWSFSALTAGRGTREELKAAVDGVQGAARQVAAALKQARRIWDQHTGGEPGGAAPPEPTGVDWRNLQRETVELWRQAQREQQQEWRSAKQRMKQDLKDELRQAARLRQEEYRRRRS